jgi:hypothetical protein
MTSTTHPAITKAQELYDLPRDLDHHEQDLLKSVHRITMACARTKDEAVRLYGDGSRAYKGTEYLANRSERFDLEFVLGRYMEADKRCRDAMEETNV